MNPEELRNELIEVIDAALADIALREHEPRGALIAIPHSGQREDGCRHVVIGVPGADTIVLLGAAAVLRHEVEGRLATSRDPDRPVGAKRTS